MKHVIICAAALSVIATSAQATSVTISSTDAIFNYGGTDATLEVGAPAGFTTGIPAVTSISPGSGQVLTFSSVTGSVNLTKSGPYDHGPDGGPSSPPGANPVDVSGAAGLSGSQASTSAGLFGVFLNGQENNPGHVAPATLGYLTLASYSAASYSPLDDQIFFIGDGLTGTNTGGQQTFIVPSDATGLVLGIVDAYGYLGTPGAYFDNAGSFNATFAINGAVPESSTWAMMILGFAGIGCMTYRRRKQVPTLIAA